MKKLLLNDGQVVLVDDDDYDKVKEFRWQAFRSNRGSTYYAKTQMYLNGNKLHLYLHRFLTGASKGVLVDHKNGDGLDNRRSNLRLATNSQNRQNAAKSPVKSSQYKGVFWWAARNKWVATCKRVFLGQFASESEAAKAYDIFALREFGEFAKVNFPVSA